MIFVNRAALPETNGQVVTKAGHTLDDFKPDFKADLHPRVIRGCGSIRGLSQAILSKNPLLCGVITIIYLPPIEKERRQTKILNIYDS